MLTGNIRIGRSSSRANLQRQRPRPEIHYPRARKLHSTPLVTFRGRSKPSPPVDISLVNISSDEHSPARSSSNMPAPHHRAAFNRFARHLAGQDPGSLSGIRTSLRKPSPFSGSAFGSASLPEMEPNAFCHIL